MLNPADTDKKRISPFSIRWNEKLGLKECPYMRRWVFNFYLFSIRIHQWYNSDDTRYKHNHAFNFLVFVLKGNYLDVQDNTSDFLSAGSIRYRKANHKHFVGWPVPGTITLLLCGPKIQNWGFFVNNKMMRPLRYFKRYGHQQCDN